MEGVQRTQKGGAAKGAQNVGAGKGAQREVGAAKGA
jgi:hypothetical protein